MRETLRKSLEGGNPWEKEGVLEGGSLEGALEGGGPLREPLREGAPRLMLLLLMLFVISMLMSLSMFNTASFKVQTIQSMEWGEGINLLEWGGAPHVMRISCVRGGVRLRFLSSVCLFVCLSVCLSGSEFAQNRLYSADQLKKMKVDFKM